MAESTIAWLPTVNPDGTIIWSRSESETPPVIVNLMGSPGAIGPKGATGQTGPRGQTGAAGAKGDQGPQGNPGLTGPKGERGDPGQDGAPGQKGDTGATGAKGDTGPAGYGVPTGGADGQIVLKDGNTPGATKWGNYGEGDMKTADYDPAGSVKLAGGIPDWVNLLCPFHNSIFIATSDVFPPIAVEGDILLVV